MSVAILEMIKNNATIIEACNLIPNSYGIFAVWVIEMCGVEKPREIKIFHENHYLVVDLHVYRAC